MEKCINCNCEDFDIQNGLCSTCGIDVGNERLNPEDYRRYIDKLGDDYAENDS